MTARFINGVLVTKTGNTTNNFELGGRSSAIDDIMNVSLEEIIDDSLDENATALEESTATVNRLENTLVGSALNRIKNSFKK